MRAVPVVAGWALGAVLSALILAGCSASGSGCDQDGDCPTGRYCSSVTDRCEFDCTFDRDCPDLFLCSDTGRCVRGCRSNGDCSVAQWCDSQQCRACDLDTHCGAACEDCSSRTTNRACLVTTCGCFDSAHCQVDEVCIDGMCAGCQPTCDGLCGGIADGCGGECPDNCPSGQRCETDRTCSLCDAADACGPGCEPCEAQQVCTEGGEGYACGCEFAECLGICCAQGENCLGGVCSSAAICGNDEVEDGEACDDGNSQDGDECSADCRKDCTGGRTFHLNCYRLLAPTDWLSGRSHCLAIGMDYSAISSPEERDFILVMKAIFAPQDSIWIGFNDLDQEGIWVWANGEPVVYVDWHPGEPNNSWPGEGENCAMVHLDMLDWHDNLCSIDSFLPLCEF